MYLISPFKYAEKCDFKICNRVDGTYPSVSMISLDMIFIKDKSKLYLNGENLVVLIDKLVQILEQARVKNLTIFVQNVEPVLNESIVKKLVPFSNCIYLVNKNIEVEKESIGLNGEVICKNIIYNLPIGIKDDGNNFHVFKDFSHKTLIKEKSKIREKNILCYLCFTTTTYPVERVKCEKALGHLSFINNGNKKHPIIKKENNYYAIPVEKNYEFTHQSKYVLCPRGLGIATYRFYESLYLDAIPIVKREKTVFNKLYDVFPCLIIDEWKDVTEELLNREYENMSKKLIEFNKKYPDWCENTDTLLEILKET